MLKQAILIAWVTLLGFSVQASGGETCRDLFDRAVTAELVADRDRVVFESNEGFRFDRLAFERVWTEIQNVNSRAHDIEVTPFSDQRTEGSEIMSIELTPKMGVMGSTKRLRVLITAGIHGNEPLGVQTALDVVDFLLKSKSKLPVELVVTPALNFDGLLKRSRRTANDVDLNRNFASNSNDGLISRIERAIGKESFDLSLDLHGANRRQHFFVIKSGADGDLAKAALSRLDSNLLLRSDEGRDTGAVGLRFNGKFDPNRYWLESPGLSVSTNSGTMKGYMAGRGTPYAYTVEYPGRLGLETARSMNLRLVLGFIEEAVRLQNENLPRH